MLQELNKAVPRDDEVWLRNFEEAKKKAAEEAAKAKAREEAEKEKRRELEEKSKSVEDKLKDLNKKCSDG